MAPFPMFLSLVCSEKRVLGIINLPTGQDVGLIPPLFYCSGTCLVLLLHGSVAKQICFLE